MIIQCSAIRRADCPASSEKWPNIKEITTPSLSVDNTRALCNTVLSQGLEEKTNESDPIRVCDSRFRASIDESNTCRTLIRGCTSSHWCCLRVRRVGWRILQHFRGLVQCPRTTGNHLAIQ